MYGGVQSRGTNNDLLELFISTPSQVIHNTICHHFSFQELACLTSEHWDVLAAELKRGGTRIKRVEASKMELNDDFFDSFFACIGAVKEAKVACKT